MKQVTICGESRDVQGKTVKSWTERLPEILSGYSKENAWNRVESGVFWRVLPNCGFGRIVGVVRKVNKDSQLLFLVSAAGTKEKPVVVWRSKNLRCLKGFINQHYLFTT